MKQQPATMFIVLLAIITIATFLLPTTYSLPKHFIEPFVTPPTPFTTLSTTEFGYPGLSITSDGIDIPLYDPKSTSLDPYNDNIIITNPQSLRLVVQLETTTQVSVQHCVYHREFNIDRCDNEPPTPKITGRTTRSLSTNVVTV